MTSRSTNSGLVYSTDAGRMCPACRQPVARCACVQARPAPAGDGTVRIARVTKGRGGKTVTVVSGLGLDGGALEAMAKTLKAACGCGGTVKDGTVEVQGDHAERLAAVLARDGYRVKRSGG